MLVECSINRMGWLRWLVNLKERWRSSYRIMFMRVAIEFMLIIISQVKLWRVKLWKIIEGSIMNQWEYKDRRFLAIKELATIIKELMSLCKINQLIEISHHRLKTMWALIKQVIHITFLLKLQSMQSVSRLIFPTHKDKYQKAHIILLQSI